jgi:hypothetical protein
MIPTFPNAGQDPRLTEKLLEANSQRRKLSVETHDETRHQMRREMLGALMDERDFDEIDHAVDEALADPIHDHRPQSAPSRKVRGVLSILDQLEKQNSNRRFAH